MRVEKTLILRRPPEAAISKDGRTKNAPNLFGHMR
jgi:hypothetical protein